VSDVGSAVLGVGVAPLGGSGAARPSGALRAIDASARPRSWRTCGPSRLRRQSQPALVATQGGTGEHRFPRWQTGECQVQAATRLSDLADGPTLDRSAASPLTPAGGLSTLTAPDCAGCPVACSMVAPGARLQ
jgi:hypothetical protein